MTKEERLREQRARYRRSPKGRETYRKINARYLRSKKGRETRRRNFAAWAARPEVKIRRAEYWKAFIGSVRGMFTMYRCDAERRGIKFEVTIEQFGSFWQKPCEYCGDSIATIGVDRIDNTLGYSVPNMAACCTVCNKMKLDQTLDGFIAQCRRIACLADAKALEVFLS